VDLTDALNQECEVQIAIDKEPTGASSLAPTAKDQFSALGSERALLSSVFRDALVALRSEIVSLSGKMREMQDELTQCKASVAQLQHQKGVAPIDIDSAPIDIDSIIAATQAEQKQCAELNDRIAHVEAELKHEREGYARTEDLAARAMPSSESTCELAQHTWGETRRKLDEAQQRDSNVSLETDQERYARLEERLEERLLALKSEVLHEREQRILGRQELNVRLERFRRERIQQGLSDTTWRQDPTPSALLRGALPSTHPLHSPLPPRT